MDQSRSKDQPPSSESKSKEGVSRSTRSGARREPLAQENDRVQRNQERKANGSEQSHPKKSGDESSVESSEHSSRDRGGRGSSSSFAEQEASPEKEAVKDTINDERQEKERLRRKERERRQREKDRQLIEKDLGKVGGVGSYASNLWGIVKFIIGFGAIGWAMMTALVGVFGGVSGTPLRVAQVLGGVAGMGGGLWIAIYAREKFGKWLDSSGE